MAERKAGPFALVFWSAVLCLVIAAVWGVTRMATRARDRGEAAPTSSGDAPSTGAPGEGAAAGASADGASPPSATPVSAPGDRSETGTTTIVDGTRPIGPAATGTPPGPGGTEPAPAAPMGTLPAEVIRDTVREAVPFIRFCFEWQLERHPELEGRVTMRWTIQPDGTVTDAGVLEDALGDETVLQCFRGVVGRLEFPPPEGGGSVTVHYPFVLAGAPEARRPEGI